MMNKRKRAISAATENGSEVKNIRKISISHLHYITVLMAATTVIAGWNITGIWSGIVALFCAMTTVDLFYMSIGEENNVKHL